MLIQAIDVRSAQSLSNFVEKAKKQFGKIDLLVANAGLGIFKRVIEMTEQEFDEQIDTNLKGVFLSVKAVLTDMIANEFGDIIIMASLAGKNSFATGSVYSASKFAVRGFAHALMLEVRDQNIRVITICPGSVDTSFFEPTQLNPEREKFLHAEDVASCVVAALLAPRRAMISEIDIRPSNPAHVFRV